MVGYQVPSDVVVLDGLVFEHVIDLGHVLLKHLFDLSKALPPDSLDLGNLGDSLDSDVDWERH